jgi:hypothetical protein
MACFLLLPTKRHCGEKAMSTSILQSSAAQQSQQASMAVMQQNYQNLFTALKTNNLQLAQTSLKALNLSANTLKSNAMLANIVSAVQSGDIQGAQQAFTGQTSSGNLINVLNEQDDSQTDTQSDAVMQSLSTNQSQTSANSPLVNLATSTTGNLNSAAAMKGVGTLFDQMV